ncbi:MAG TPA: acetyl-CoA carboxylase biotin carboxyl carrier protein subunit [Steroidobacteraceae bacterium]|nr:acetyl-CoA carboxylase biotin carboxyl carrier protein subunit [Steroidobacteraceae bacterium]
MQTPIHSEIAGIVLEIKLAPGSAVAIDEVVLMVECMKMYIPIASPVAGRIHSVAVAEGALIEEGQLAFVVESSAS